MRGLGFVVTLLVAAAPTHAIAKADPAVELLLANQAMIAGRCEEARKRVDPLIRDRLLAEGPKSLAHAIRASCFLMGGQSDKGWQELDTAEAIAPTLSMLPDLRFALGTGVGDFAQSQKALDRLIGQFPDVARALEPEAVFKVLRWLRAEKRVPEAEALTRRLGDIGFGGDNFVVRGDVLHSAVRLALQAGDLEDARRLAKEIVSHPILTEMLVDRRFSAIWPDIEANAGPKMDTATAAAVLYAQAWAQEKPDLLAAQANLMRALHYRGDFAAAKRVGAQMVSADAMAGLDEAGGWAVDSQADMLAAAGDIDAADRRSAELTTLPVAERGWLISMIINRIERLVGNDRHDAALALLPDAVAKAKTYGSPYAQQLLRRLQICALAGLSRGGEAAALADDMLKHDGDAPAATVDGLVCLDRGEDAESRVVALLSGTDDLISALMRLQKEGSLGMGDPSRWDGFWRPLLDRPKVREAFDKTGRDLPPAMSGQPDPSLLPAKPAG